RRRGGGLGRGGAAGLGGGGFGGGGGRRGGGGGGGRGGGRQANLGTEGPSNFDYRGMDAPSAPISFLVYDPEDDTRRSNGDNPQFRVYGVTPTAGQLPAGGSFPPGQPPMGQPMAPPSGP